MNKLFPPLAALALVTLPLACSGSVVGGGGGGTSTGLAQSGVQHASCTSPTPEPLPALPEINMGPGGRPRFDDWRDLDCNDPNVDKVPTCNGGGCPQSGMCLSGPGEGVCIFGDSDLSCDGEGEVIGYRDGACWMCGLVTAKAKACCLGLPGFDCRKWPYPADGAPGMVCARHEDCEPGLVCGSTQGKGYGICQCPGANVTLSDTCF